MPATTTQSLPPTGRDFLIYGRIVEGASTRALAADFSLSQTRIRQIASRVVQWLAQALPHDVHLDDAARLRFGQHLAADRLEHLYCDAMTDWRSTRQPKFAGLAIRVTLAQARLPAFSGTLEALLADAIDANQDLSAAPSEPEPTPAPIDSNSAFTLRKEPDVQTETSVSNPPSRDCSTPPHSLSHPPAHGANGRGITPSLKDTSARHETAPRAARRAFFAPAHLAAVEDNDSPVTQLKITPQALGLSAKKAVSRKQRRRLQRMALAK